MAKWQIGRHVPKCATCEKEFGAGERLYSMLAVGEDGLERRDLCLECYSDDAVAGALFWWRTRHLVEESRGLKLDLEAIEALFLALDPDRVAPAESETEAQPDDAEGDEVVSRSGPVSERLLELRYLMCLILLRKRRVKVLKVARRHNGIEGEFFIVKRPRRQEEIAVQVFDFDADKIAAVRADLQRVFEGADPAELEAGEGEEAVVEASPQGGDPDETAEAR